MDRLERAGYRDPYHVKAYRGYGAGRRALVLGRAMEDEGLAEPDPKASRWRNLVHALKRLEGDPLPFAPVRARLAGYETDLRADDEGFVRAWVELPAPLPTGGWHPVELELREPRGPAAPKPTRSSTSPTAPGSSTTSSPISWTPRRSRPGRWSSATWTSAFGFRRRPPHKPGAIAEILATYPELPFILVGDSGEEDPEIYRAVVHDHPGRILAVYIRNMLPHPERVAAVRRLAEERSGDLP